MAWKRMERRGKGRMAKEGGKSGSEQGSQKEDQATVVVSSTSKQGKKKKEGAKWVLTSVSFLTIDSYLTPIYTMRVKAGQGFDVIKELRGGGGDAGTGAGVG